MWVVGREYIDREGTKWLDLEAGNLTSHNFVFVNFFLYDETDVGRRGL